MALDNLSNASELATPKDYRSYFGVPPKTSTPREFLRWAQSICTAVTRELDGTTLTSGQRDILRHGLTTALKVLSGDYAGAMLR
jgi:hypothetical protein